MTRLQGQIGMEKTMVVMVFLLLVGLSQAAIPCDEDKQCRRDVCIDLNCASRSLTGGRCNSNSHCFSSANVCINEMCSLKSPPGGTCDANDNPDCAVASSTCSANNICLSPTDGQCFQNNQCALSSDSCIGLLCKPKGKTGGTCDASDNADCVSGYKCVGTSCAFDLSPFKWEGNKAMATSRNFASSVAVGGFLFVFGGFLPSGSLTNSVEMYNPSSNTWVSKANMPISTWKHSVVVVGNFVYLIGGADASNIAQNNFFRYDTVNNVWTTLGELPVLPASLHSMAATVVGSTIFTLGGQSASSTTTAVNNIFSFDTSTSQWTTTLPSLPLTLTQASAVTVGSMIFITGGISVGTVQTKTFKFNTAALPLVAPQDANLALTVGRSYHASFFNPISNKIHLVGGVSNANKANTMETLDLNNPSPVWTSEPTAALNLINTASSGGLINNRIHLPGISTNAGFEASNLLYVLDITSSPKWVPFAPSPTPASTGVVGKVGSSIITGVGLNQLGEATTLTSKYSISSNSWSSLPGATLSDRYYVASAVVGSEVYSIGGYDIGGSVISSTNALNAGQTAWIPKANLKVARYGLCAASEGNRIFAFGGYGPSGSITDTMEIYDASLNTWTDVTISSKSSGFSATALAYCAAVSTGTKILIFGGQANSGAKGLIQSFDILTQKWDAPITTSFISARYSLSATVLNGFVIVTGGISVNTLAKVEAYEISTGIVTSLPDMPSPRWGHGSVTDGDSVFVVGGINGALIAPLEKFRAFP